MDLRIFYGSYEQVIITFLEFRKMLSLIWDSMSQHYGSWMGLRVVDEAHKIDIRLAKIYGILSPTDGLYGSYKELHIV